MIDWGKIPNGSTVWLRGGTPLEVELKYENHVVLRYPDGSQLRYYECTGFSKSDPQILYTSPEEAIAASDWHPGDYVYIPGMNAPPQRLEFRGFSTCFLREATRLSLEFCSDDGRRVILVHFKKGESKAMRLADFGRDVVPVYYSHGEAYEAEYKVLLKLVNDTEDRLNRVALDIRDVLSKEGLGD